jgi:hypothetical protein
MFFENLSSGTVIIWFREQKVPGVRGAPFELNFYPRLSRFPEI